MNVQDEPVITKDELFAQKKIADELGDLMLNFFYNGLYQAFKKYLAIMLHIVNQQLYHDLDPSLTGFHFFSFMNQSNMADLTMLKRICISQAKFAAVKAMSLSMNPRIASLDNPSKLRVGYWGYDAVKCSALSQLVHNLLRALILRLDLIVFLICGKADLDPFSKQLETAYKTKNQLIVLPLNARPQTVLNKVSELNLHVLVDLSEYTHGNYLEVWNKCPAECQVQTLGFAGPMFSKAYDYMLCGSYALDPKQKD